MRSNGGPARDCQRLGFGVGLGKNVGRTLQSDRYCPGADEDAFSTTALPSPGRTGESGLRLFPAHAAMAMTQAAPHPPSAPSPRRGRRALDVRNCSLFESPSPRESGDRVPKAGEGLVCRLSWGTAAHVVGHLAWSCSMLALSKSSASISTQSSLTRTSVDGITRSNRDWPPCYSCNIRTVTACLA